MSASEIKYWIQIQLKNDSIRDYPHVILLRQGIDQQMIPNEFKLRKAWQTLHLSSQNVNNMCMFVSKCAPSFHSRPNNCNCNM